MKKIRFWLAVLGFALVLGISASAAAYSDVEAGSWYYDDVMTLHDAGIIQGYPDGSFRPAAQVSYAEALKMILGAAGYTVDETGAETWFGPYLDYAVRAGIADADTGIAPGDAITRDRAAELIVRAMGLPLDVETAARPFADSVNVYAITLHGAGIIRGEMSGGLFYYRGERSLNRAELATIVVRMMRRDETPEVGGAHPLLPAGCSLPEAPRTVEDFVQALMWLSVNGRDEHTFIYRGVGIETVRDDYLPNLSAAYPIATDLCRETVIYYHYYQINFAYTRNYVAMTLRLRGKEYTAEQCRAMIDFTLAEGQAVADAIRAGAIPDSATPERDYARAALDWVVTHCRYGGTEGMLDQYAYSVFAGGESVCSGYTAAYNLLLKLGGIKCMSMTGHVLGDGVDTPHAWTIAALDGEVVWIDATWCDPIGQADDATNHTYFALSEAEFAARHRPLWDYRLYWDLLD